MRGSSSRTLALACAALSCLAISGCDPETTEPATYPGHHSWDILTTGNGLCAATYEAGGINKLTAFKNHCYSNYDASTPSKSFLYDLYFGYRLNGGSSAATWLSASTPLEAGYVDGTAVIRTLQKSSGLSFETWYFTPFSHPSGEECPDRLLVAITKVVNEGPAASDCSVFTLFNFHMGGDGDSSGESLAADASSGAMYESRGQVGCLYRPLSAEHLAWTADVAGGPANPWKVVVEGGHYASPAAAAGDDLAAGFENPIAGGGAFGAGECGWYGSVVGFTDEGLGYEALSANVEAFIAGRSPEEILAAEIAWWSGWHQSDDLPPGISAAERDLARQSLAVLKMGQVREAGNGYGQILASLVPGHWNISWVRDASYAIMGLVAAGHRQEARDALEFMLLRGQPDDSLQEDCVEGSASGYPSWGAGIDLPERHLISFCRYFGNGAEESDLNAQGYNIEWDGLGLFLWALDDYSRRYGYGDIVEPNWTAISTRVADLIPALVDPSTGVLHPDSSIWERHWAPYGSTANQETRKRYAYSSITAWRGLLAAAEMADRLPAPDASRAAVYRQHAAALRQAILDAFVVLPEGSGKPALVGSIELWQALGRGWDQSVVEAINTGLVDPAGEVAAGTLGAFDLHLAIGGPSPGYFRNDDAADGYNDQEWVMIDLRTVPALAAAGRQGKARALLDWVTDQSARNYNLIAELYRAGTADYDSGAVPMCGFGPGAYLLALEAMYPR